MTDKDKAYVANYPVLDEWLKNHEARCMWQARVNKTARDDRDYGGDYVECWMTPDGGTFILLVMSRGRGWNVFTPTTSPRIADTFADAEARLGLAKAAPPLAFDDVYAWCEEYDGHATEGWLTMLLNGEVSVDEMRSAIRDKREVRR